MFFFFRYWTLLRLRSYVFAFEAFSFNFSCANQLKMEIVLSEDPYIEIVYFEAVELLKRLLRINQTNFNL